jgi:uncharacterized membrane-anchored protein
MEETKTILQSRAFWGGLVAVLSGVAGMIGYTVDADTQEGVVGLIMAIVGGVGGLLAIYGRVKATKKIK